METKTLLLLTSLAVVAWLPAGAGDWDDCAACHEKLTRTFEATTHGRLAEFELFGVAGGCSGCHGNAVAHMDEGGDASVLTPPDIDTCLTCHRSGELHDWEGSAHALSDVACVDCHDVHDPARASDPAVCYDCHQDVRAQLDYPSHHPVREGHLRCGSCHQPHGSSIGGLRVDERSEDLCFECHSSVQGPFLFEHEPVSEGCDNCHTPHGSVANNLLVQNEPFLCLQCHEMHFHAGLEAEEDLAVRIPRYDPTNPLGVATDIDRHGYPGGFVPNPFGESGYRRAFTTRCTQCHTHVHGTDLPSQTTAGQGNGLMR